MKNDSFLSIAMDLAGENVSSNENDDEEMDFTNGSCYNQGEGFEPRQSSNVNSSPSQWPLRHNNHNESLEKNSSYSCNGFSQAKKHRYTYTGRISRTPSRYLDTDSDSGDGSVRKDCQHRLKIKRGRRRRKLASGTSKKLLANGFKDHENSALPSVVDSEVNKLTENFGDREWLASVEYPDVLEDSSPISNDKISHLSHNTKGMTRSLSDASLSNEIISSEDEYSKAKDFHAVVNESNRTAEHSSKSSGRCVDIYTHKHNARPRLTEPKDEGLFETHSVQTEEFESIPAALTKMPCKRKALHEFSKSDSSAKETVVSSKQLLNDCQLSCAIHNDKTAILLESKNYKECEECVVDSSHISGKITQHIDENVSGLCSDTVRDIGNKLSNNKRLVKTNSRSNKKRTSRDIEAEGLEPVNSLKMRKALAKKFKQKQLRRVEKTDKNDNLKRNKKNGLICKVKEKVNSEKQGKQANKMKVKDTKVAKSSKHSDELHSVLGMRRSPTGVYEFLVQWHNGTSCWVSSDDVVTDKHNYYLREYLVQSEQDVSVVNRVPFQAYCCDSLSLKECKPTPRSKTALRKMLCVEEPVQKMEFKSPLVPTKHKDDVNVEFEESCCYITLNRETCKRKITCLKIVTHLITALEDAATSECEVVVIRGLQSDIFCGLRLDDMSKTGVEKENGILSQARYLVQTLTSYPKLLIALVTKPARGISAVFLSLCDMICDEEIWDQKEVLDQCKKGSKEFAKVCALPRVTGHSLLSEEVLMGKYTEDPEHCDPILFTDETCLDDSSTVSCTLAEVNEILRRLRKQSSLLRVNGEIFPSTDPQYAFFAHGFTAEDSANSLLNSSVSDNLVASETNNERECDQKTSTKIVCESNSETTSSSHSRLVTDQNNSTDQCAANHFTSHTVSVEPTTVEDVLTDTTTVLDSNTNDSNRKQNSIDDRIIDQNTVQTAMDYTDNERAALDYSLCDQSANDNVVSDSCAMIEEADNNEACDGTLGQTTTDTCSLAERELGNARTDNQNIDRDMTMCNVSDLVASDNHVKTTNETIDLYRFVCEKDENRTDETNCNNNPTHSRTLTDCKSVDVTMGSSDITDDTMSYSTSDCFTTGNNEERVVKLLTSASDVTPEHEYTGDMCNTSEESISDEKTTNKDCVSTDTSKVVSDVACKVEPTMENIKDKTSNHVVSGDDDCAMRLEDQAENAERFKKDKKNEQANESTILRTSTSCHFQQTTMVDTDTDITNNSTTTDSYIVEHQGSMAHVSTCAVCDNTYELTSMNDNEITASTTSVAAAVDRYIKKLQAQIDNEKQKTKQLHFEQVSRFPFVYNNK